MNWNSHSEQTAAPEPDDQTLLRRHRSGDSRAFGELINRHAKRLYAAAYALLGNSADAEDAVQETLAGAFRGIGKFRGEASVKTWLLRILMNQAARIRRSRHKWRIFPLMGSGGESSTPDPTTPDPVTATDSKMDVARLLDALSDEHREVIVLRELQGMSYEEIAETISVPRGTVESRLHRARQELKTRFGQIFNDLGR